MTQFWSEITSRKLNSSPYPPPTTKNVPFQNTSEIFQEVLSENVRVLTHFPNLTEGVKEIFLEDSLLKGFNLGGLFQNHLDSKVLVECKQKQKDTFTIVYPDVELSVTGNKEQ